MNTPINASTVAVSRKPWFQSLTLRGLGFAAASQLAARVGLEVGPDDWAQLIDIVAQAMTLAGVAMAWVGRVRKGDLD